jgi:hypothetical protein
MYKPFLAVAVLVYAGLAVGHVFRAITSTQFVIAGVALPAWSSWPAAGFAILLAFLLWREMTREAPSSTPS